MYFIVKLYCDSMAKIHLNSEVFKFYSPLILHTLKWESAISREYFQKVSGKCITKRFQVLQCKSMRGKYSKFIPGNFWKSKNIYVILPYLLFLFRYRDLWNGIVYPREKILQRRNFLSYFLAYIVRYDILICFEKYILWSRIGSLRSLVIYSSI